MKPIQYRGYLISLNDYILNEKFTFIISSIDDCDEPIDWAETIEKAKILIDEKFE